MKIRSLLIIFLVLLISLNLAFIWSHSLYSKTESAEQSGEIVNGVSNAFSFLGFLSYETLDIVIRKLAHFSEFFSLGTLCSFLTYLLTIGNFRDYRYNCAVTSLLCLAAASTDEMLQIFSGRGNMISDVLLDFSGAVTGIVFAAALLYLIKEKPNRIKRLRSR